MIKFSEYVSLGHPDKIADYISQYLLDRYIERDPDTRYAVEVQIKDYHVTLGGEISSKANFKAFEIERFVREAVNEIGYTLDYVIKWGLDNTICGDMLEVTSLISQQSPDIAQGLTGWGDQGIFFGYAEPNAEYGHMPKDHAIAKRLCKELFESGIGGLDIKTQVITEDDNIKEIIVAIPLLEDTSTKKVKHFVRTRVKGTYKLTVNGTGRYVTHSSIADCGTTGRKLAVDFYGGNCRIGGGSPWTKDASKADLTLNLLARKMAKEHSTKFAVPVIACIACCIGQKRVAISVRDLADNVLFESREIEVNPIDIRHDFNLDLPLYASMCRWGLFGEFQQDKVWEK